MIGKPELKKISFIKYSAICRAIGMKRPTWDVQSRNIRGAHFSEKSALQIAEAVERMGREAMRFAAQVRERIKARHAETERESRKAVAQTWKRRHVVEQEEQVAV